MSESFLVLQAGQHDRVNCPFEIPLEKVRSLCSSHGSEAEMQSPEGILWQIVSEGEHPERIPLQKRADTFQGILPFLEAKTQRSYRLEPVSFQKTAVTLTDVHGTLDISVHEQTVTQYHYQQVPARPCFWPLHAPGQIPVTRAYPMISDAPGETRDHPHHRSLWIAFGEVNGQDNWSEEADHAFTRHERFDLIQSGPVFGEFRAVSHWVDRGGKYLLTETLLMTTWAVTGTVRLLDFHITLEAERGDVTFGDTKEGGILSVRVATELDVPRTGRITNVYGGINEAECWGKSSHWCDYSGSISNVAAGIAVFDHPESFRYPTHWHVRNYGLMTANPFAYAQYQPESNKNGRHTLPEGEKLIFRYRVMPHLGDCQQASVNAHYLNFVSPPTVILAQPA